MFGRRDVLDHGWVILDDMMPHENADRAVAQAARQSYAAGTKSEAEDKRLIRYLIEHGHGSPFEMVEFKFQLHVPEVVFRHLIRYRIAEWNVQSGRFVRYDDVMYRPALGEWRYQDARNKQGSAGTLPLSDGHELTEALQEYQTIGQLLYQQALARGVAREQARLFLPGFSVYSMVMMKMNARSLMHLIDQRTAPDAQYETRQYAEAFKYFFDRAMPWTAAALADLGKRSV